MGLDKIVSPKEIRGICLGVNKEIKMDLIAIGAGVLVLLENVGLISWIVLNLLKVNQLVLFVFYRELLSGCFKPIVSPMLRFFFKYFR